MHRLLFICSANMCRSPMAEALFSNLLKQRGDLGDWYVSSAGVWALEGNRASEGAVKAMERRGIDLRSHRARQVTAEMIIDSDLILVMEQNHKEALRASFPRFASKIYLLSEMVGLSHDIRDPIGGMAADYDDTADELEKLFKAGFLRIQLLVGDQKDRMGR